MKPHLDLVGQRFGRLTVIALHGRKPKTGFLWLCKCDCGGETIAPTGELRRTRKGLQSCGCMGRENQEKFKKRFATSRIDELLPLREAYFRVLVENKKLSKQVRAYASA